MSTFVSNNDQKQVTEANQAPFRLKAMNDITDDVLQSAVKTFNESSRFDDDDGIVTFGNGDMSFDFIDSDGNVENPSTDHTRIVQQPADKNMGMETCAKPDETRHTVGGKGLLEPVSLGFQDAENSDEDVEMSEDINYSEDDAGISDQHSDMFEEDEASEDGASEDDAEDHIVHSAPTRSDIGMKTCVKPNRSRYTVGGKGLAKAKDSNEDQIDTNSPIRSATGMKSCTKPDSTRYTVGGKGPIQYAPSHIEHAEISEEDSDESDYDMDSEEGERQELVNTVREDIEERLEAIANLNQQVAAQRNVILKKRLQAKINSLEEEMRVKMASLEDSEATETEFVDETSQHQNNENDPVTENIGNVNAASNDKPMAQSDDQSECWPGEKVSVNKYIEQKLRSTPKKKLAKIAALDAVIEWYTREKYQVLDASRWADLENKVDEHREKLAKLLRFIGIDEDRPQDEAWGWAIRLNEQIRTKWQDCDQNDPLANHKIMEEIDEMNEKRRMKLEAVSKEDCRVTLLGWVSLKDRKPLPNEAISAVESPIQQQTGEDASSQQATKLSAPIVESDVVMTEASDFSTQSNGNIEQSALTTEEDATAGINNDAINIDGDFFGDGPDSCVEYSYFAAATEASNASEPLLDTAPVSLQTPVEVVESHIPSLPSAEAVITPKPQVIAVDSNAGHIQAEALPTVPAVTSEVNSNQQSLGSVPTFDYDSGATQSPQVAEAVGTGLSVLTEDEEALFEELIDVTLLEQDVQQDQVPVQQEPMLAPVQDHICQTSAGPQDTPVTASQDPMLAPVQDPICQASAGPQQISVIASQDGAVLSEATDVSGINGVFKSSAEWNDRPELPTLDEFLQFMDDTTQQQIRAEAWAKIQDFVHPDKLHPAQLDVFAFAPPEIQEPILAEYEKQHREGGQFALPLLQSHCDDPKYSAQTPVCVCLSSFVVQMYAATETQPDEILNEQAQPATQPAVQHTVITSGSLDLDSLDLSSFDFSGPIQLEDIANAFADVKGDQSTSSIEHVQETIEEPMIPDVTIQTSMHQNSLQVPELVVFDEPVQARNGTATNEAAQGRKSAPAKKKTAAPRKTAAPKKKAATKRKGPELPLQEPIDENTFSHIEQGDVVECPVTSAQDAREGLNDWASTWCKRSWSEEDPEPRNRTPAELARLQQLGMKFSEGMRTASLIPSPNTSAILVGAINDHVSQVASSGASAHESKDVPAPVEQEASAKPANRSHRGRPASPPESLRKTRTRKLKHPESPQKVPSGKYTRRKSKLPKFNQSESSVLPQQPENASGQPTVYYEAAPNRRLGLDTAPEDWVAQSTNKRKRVQPAKETQCKAQKTQQPTPVSLQSNASVLSGNGTYRAILPRLAPAQTPYSGMQTPDPTADSPKFTHDSMSAPEPMMLAYSSPAQQATEPNMGPTLTGMPPNVPAQASQQGLQQVSGEALMMQHNLQRGMSSSTVIGSNGGIQDLKQPIQQQPLQSASLDDMDDSDDEHEEIMRLLHRTERKMERQKALRKIAEMNAEMRRDALNDGHKTQS